MEQIGDDRRFPMNPGDLRLLGAMQEKDWRKYAPGLSLSVIRAYKRGEGVSPVSELRIVTGFTLWCGEQNQDAIGRILDAIR